MANFCYTMASLLVMRGSVNMREAGTTYASDATARDMRIMLVCGTSTAGPAGTANGGNNAEDITAVGSFTSLQEYNGTNYVPGFAGAGRKVLANQAVTGSFAGSHRANFDCDDLVWTALGLSSTGAAKGLLVFFQPPAAASDADLIPFAWIDTVASGTAFGWSGSGGDVTYTMPANGLIQFGHANSGSPGGLAVFG